MATTVAQETVATDQATPDAVRPPPGNPRFPLLDSVRAVAAISVLVTHVTVLTNFNFHTLGEFPARLDIGVTLFFILSGFLLYRPFVAARLDGHRRPRIPIYARRRVLRIVPAFWFALTVLAIWPGLAGDVFGRPWAYYSFFQWTSGTTLLGGIPVAWSLTVEVWFYVALPFYALGVARALRGRSRTAQVRIELVVLAVLAVASIAARQANFLVERQSAAAPHSTFLWTLPAYLYWFALGMGMATISAALYHRSDADQPRVVRAITARPWLAWLGAAALFVVLAEAMDLPRSVEPVNGLQFMGEHVLYGLTSLLFVLPAVFGATAGGWPRRVLANRQLAWLGLISYGIFLWHLPLANKIASWPAIYGFHFTTLVALVLTFVAACACATFSYYVVERPFLRLKETGRYGRRSSQRT
jgi:peptidoglycan/LPS O-acetylase OafA/YrhL